MHRAKQGGNRSRGVKSKVAGIAIALLVALYAVAAPQLNERYGWSLPALDQTNQRAENRDSSFSELGSESTENRTESADSEASSAEAPSEMAAAKQWLNETNPDVFLSPAGLVYGPGSAEGHRLEHLRRHAADIPDRPGPHGVFDGGLLGALQAVDEAWKLAQRNTRTDKEVDGRRTVYTVNLQQSIGFVGGRTGRERGHPEATRLRLVLEGNRVITAYPMESR